MDAERRTSLKIPSPARKARGLVRIDASGTEIDQISRKGALKRSVLISTEIGSMGKLHGAQVAIPRKILIKSAASPAVNTAIHLVLDKYPQVLIVVGPLLSEIAPESVASCNRQILGQTMSAFIADRAVMRMIHHQPFNHVFAEVDCLPVVRRDGHPIAGIHHAAHLNAFDRTFKKLHRAYPASTDRSETRMKAETGDGNPQPRRCLYHFRPLLYLYFKAVNF